MEVTLVDWKWYFTNNFII